MKIKQLEVSILPYEFMKDNNHVRIRLKVIADGEVFESTKLIEWSDFESIFDAYVYNAVHEIKRLVKGENIEGAPK